MTGQDGFELVVFDCDGVLVDSEVIAIRVDQRVLADLGWDLELDDIVERFVGKSEAHFVAAVEQQLGIRLADGWDRDYGRWYQEAFERDLEAVDGIEEALDRLSLPHCVASSGSHEKMHRTLGKTGLLPRFQGRIYSATEVANGKPAPDLFLHAAASLRHRARAVRRRRGQCLRRPGRPGGRNARLRVCRGCHPGRATGRSRDHRLFRHAAAARAHRGRAARLSRGPTP